MEAAQLYVAPALVASVAGDLVRGDSERVQLDPIFNAGGDAVSAICAAVVDELQAPAPLGRLYAETLGHVLALHLLAGSSARARLRTPRACGLPVPTLRRVLEYIHTHLADDLPLADLAALASLSPYHFLRQFRRSTGVAPHQYHMRVRLERAAALLRVGTLPGIAIAHAVGFADHSHLIRHFRRAYGTVPSTWRTHPPQN